MTVRAYDYVIAGGGAAGCALAARLAEDAGKRVLLVEAGGRGRSPFITMPAGNGFLLGHPHYDWGFSSVPQPGLDHRRIYYPRGRALGGSTIMNGMIYIRGNPRDYDAWRQRGLEGWGFRDLLPYFKRSEGSGARSGPWHGRDGPLRTSLSVNFTRIDRLFIEAARQAGAAENPDFNGTSQIGVGRLDFTIARGRRMSAARAYLSRAPANLEVRTRTRVLGVALQGKRAVGLRVVAGPGGTEETVRAAREVVLSLGAFASPQILMLSGLGPADHLRRHGIRPILDLPGVGGNLQDHLNVPVRYACADDTLSLARYQRLDRAVGLGIRYLLTRSGPGASPFWSACPFEALDDPEVPDLQIFFTPMVISETITEENTLFSGSLRETRFDLGRRVFARGKRAITGFQFDINQMRPDARGELRLAGSDPLAPPLIDPRFLSETKERDQLLAGVRRVREIVSQGAFDGVRGPELSPGASASTDAQIAAAVAAAAITGHHPIGTCKMGIDSDPAAVVDGELRLRGIDNLRVVDASVFPAQITGNPNAAITAIAEKAADMMLGRPPLPAEDPG